MSVEVKQKAKIARERDALRALLVRHLSAWEDEEPSVQAEHAALIRATRRLLAQLGENT